MEDIFKSTTRKNASDDLRNRTLAAIPGELARLVYLASTRDYNSGRYHHEGLSARFGFEQAQEALQDAHRAVFFRLSSLSLERLVEELETYLRASHEAAGDFIQTWQELEPYRIAIPKETDAAQVQLFLSNVRIGLEILRCRQEGNRTGPPVSSPRQLLGL